MVNLSLLGFGSGRHRPRALDPIIREWIPIGLRRFALCGTERFYFWIRRPALVRENVTSWNSSFYSVKFVWEWSLGSLLPVCPIVTRLRMGRVDSLQVRHDAKAGFLYAIFI